MNIFYIDSVPKCEVIQGEKCTTKRPAPTEGGRQASDAYSLALNGAQEDRTSGSP